MFDKWDVNFVSPIYPLEIWIGTRYIITTKDYLTRWDEATPIKYCTAMTVARFLFDYVVTRFGFLKILLSNQGMHFVNQMIEKLNE